MRVRMCGGKINERETDCSDKLHHYSYLDSSEVSLKIMNAEKIHLTLTLGEVDALLKSGRFGFALKQIKETDAHGYLVSALQKLDAAVNV